jgi:hypothetical protein
MLVVRVRSLDVVIVSVTVVERPSSTRRRR